MVDYFFNHLIEILNSRKHKEALEFSPLILNLNFPLGIFLKFSILTVDRNLKKILTVEQ